MRRTTRRGLAVAVAAAIVGAFAPAVPANAASVARLEGGCGFDSDATGVLDDGHMHGVINDLSVAHEAAGLPLHAIVSCWIDVNGVEAPGTRLTVSDDTVPYVEFGERTTTFAALDTDQIVECESVTLPPPWVWVAQDGAVGTDCPFGDFTFPPAQIIDALNFLFSEVLDPAICPVLVPLAQLTGGGVAGVVEIRPDGDVYTADPLGLGLNPVYNCPPYPLGAGSRRA